MLTTSGCLFHIDFEYILGNDPKPFAPPMRLSEQMVMAMGVRSSAHARVCMCVRVRVCARMCVRMCVRVLARARHRQRVSRRKGVTQTRRAIQGRNSRHYLEFQKFCCKAYLILRKHARLFLNLLDLARELNATNSPLSFRSGQVFCFSRTWRGV